LTASFSSHILARPVERLRVDRKKGRTVTIESPTRRPAK
jgi:hypothetical protein